MDIKTKSELKCAECGFNWASGWPWKVLVDVLVLLERRAVFLFLFVVEKLNIWQDDWKRKSSYPTTDRSSIYFPAFKSGGKGVEQDGLLKSRVHLSHSFLFILLVCFFFLLITHPLPPTSPPPIFNTLSLCPLSISRTPLSSLLPLFSSLLLPREKRFCLLLVSAPSQSAFLISSYCFCLIFKCYPGPNGNPYRGKKKKSEEWAGRESEGKRNRLGIVFHSRTPRQKPHHHPTTPPQGKIWRVLGGGGVRRAGVGGWVSAPIRRGDIFLWHLSAPRTTL